MEGRPTDFWGKLREHEGEIVAWHPLSDHCADVAACAEALLQNTLLGLRLANLAGLEQLNESQIARMCVLVALHDLGKFNQHFQNKGRPGQQPRAGHVREFAVILDPAAMSHDATCVENAVGLRELCAWGEDELTVDRLLIASIGHHGRPAPYAGAAMTNDPARWRVAHGLDPFEGMARLVEATRRWFPAAWAPDASKLPKAQGFAHAFAGLVTLADWIGSDRELFPYSETPTDRMPFAREAAAKSLREMHLDVRADRAAMTGRSVDFSAVTAQPLPHDAQARTLALALPISASRCLNPRRVRERPSRRDAAPRTKTHDGGRSIDQSATILT